MRNVLFWKRGHSAWSQRLFCGFVSDKWFARRVLVLFGSNCDDAIIVCLFMRLFRYCRFFITTEFGSEPLDIPMTCSRCMCIVHIYTTDTHNGSFYHNSNCVSVSAKDVSSEPAWIRMWIVYTMWESFVLQECQIEWDAKAAHSRQTKCWPKIFGEMW